MEVTAGQLLVGKYRVERVLGRGGMGVVVAAHHVALDQVVAIKFLLPDALHSAEGVARFEREARAAVKIQSEHVARVSDVGRLENGAPYMVMELLRGRDLEQLLRERGPLPLAEVADYVLQAGEAIAEAHGLGIVHRDLKPPNLFLTVRADGSPCIKVLDFGISKLTGSGSNSDQGMTSTTAVMGSPLYMSPEQLMSARDVDMRTDIWALGVICFELLTGKLPFQGDTLPQLCMAISLTAPTSLRSYRPDLPLEVEAMVARCLSKDPNKRFPSVAALAAELVKFAPPHARLSAERIDRMARSSGFSGSSLPQLSPPSPLSASGSVAADTHDRTLTIGEFGRTRSVSSSSKMRIGAVVAVVLALLGAAAFKFSQQPALPKLEALPASVPAQVSSHPEPPAAAKPPVEPALPEAPAEEPASPPPVPTPSVRPHAAAAVQQVKPKVKGKANTAATSQPVAAPVAPPAAAPAPPPAPKPKPASTGSVFDDR